MPGDVPSPFPQAVSYPIDGGLRLAGDAWGESDAPPVLLLHGGGQTRHAWGGTARSLAVRGWRAVSLDLRGHGESDWSPDGRYSLETFVADLHSVIAHFDRQPALVGASLGGFAALLAQGESSSPISSAIVLVDIAPRVESQGVERIISFMRAHPEGFQSVEEAADTVASYLRHRPRPPDPRGLRKNLRRRDDGRYYWHWDPRFLSDSLIAQTRDTSRLMAAAQSLRVPALLVRGRLSDVVSEAATAEFLATAPNIEFVDVSDAGHMVAGDSNDAFTDAVIEFLSNKNI